MRDLIARLGRVSTRLSRRLAGPGERGAIGVLVAVLVAGGVLFGIGALVIDTGQLYQNRAELQSGADAAALAVARSCAVNTANCTPSLASSLAAQYASDNASKLTGGAAAATVCGSGLGGCPANTGQIYDCPTPAPAGNYVDVHTSTKLSNGSTLLPPVFSRTLAGNGNYQGSTVKACARAEWGAPLAATLIGVTISACSWDADTSQGTSFAPAPPYPPNPLPAASFDQVLQLHGTHTSGNGCPTEPAGADAPGNFGWTTDLNGNCTVTVSGSSYGGGTGNSVSNDCKTALSNSGSSSSTAKVVYIPVYVSLSGTGNNVTYTLKGFAAFVVTGYHMPSFTSKDWLNPANDCKGSSFCLNGYFTQGLIPATDVTGGLGGPNLGADTIKLAG
jgi:Flp pilus assembly protein TadG